MLIVLSLFTVLVGLAGFAVTRVPPHESTPVERAALATAAGVLVDYTLVLCGLDLAHVLGVLVVLAACGLVKAWKARRNVERGATAGTVDWGTVALAAYILGLYYLVVLSEPLVRWDARSIWFFHAKMIWSEGGLRLHAGFTHPSVAFSHPDYPNLVPAIAAQLARMRGFWNEYLPKASLIVVLVPPVLWTMSFGRRPLAFVTLAALGFFSLDGWLSNGYMDPYLGLYAGFALVLFGRHLAEGRRADLYSTLCALGIMAGLKNEGLVVVLCFVAAVTVWAAFARRGTALNGARRLVRDVGFLWVCALAAVPTVIWTALKAAWGVGNDMTADTGVNASRLGQRLADGTSVGYLLHFLGARATEAWLLALLALGLIVLLKLRGRRVPPGAAVAVLTSVAYFCAMYVVYLVTPYNLTWHLTTSAGRTMFTVTVGLLASLFLLFSPPSAECSTADAVADGRVR